MELEQGRVYKRTDIHQAFGGQRQGGISTPANESVILIFSSARGENFGYQDGWTEDSTFLYTGEGQVGDMEFIKGNSAIRDHEENGKKILLFIEARRSHFTFESEVRCVDYNYFRTPDRDNVLRRGIKFTLERIPIGGQQTESTERPARRQTKPNKTERKGLVTSRVGQGYYRQSLVDKFDGKCAATGCDLGDILIASHILPWRISNDEERLDVENGILLSPNYDALFDKHLISFNDEGEILISPLLSQDDCVRLGIDDEARIAISNGMKPYLSQHREALR